jgi:ribosomal-protein-alanine N-acetyltransferase
LYQSSVFYDLPKYQALIFEQKIGTNLIKRFLEIMYDKNIRKIYLEVRTNNEIAIQFYKKLGFNVYDVIPMFYQSGEDAYAMSKCL